MYRLRQIRLIRSAAVWAAFFATASAVVGCTSSPRYRPASHAAETTDNELVTYAKSFLGTPYAYGGESRSGMDCSGLVTTVYRQFDVQLPRTAHEQAQYGRDISRGGVEPGDLVFFQITRSRPVSHVGIYIGDGKFIHASTSARQVRIDAMSDDYFRRRFVKAKRVLQS